VTISSIFHPAPTIWTTYPDKPTAQFHEDVREYFAQALFEKDLYYLQFNVMAG